MAILDIAANIVTIVFFMTLISYYVLLFLPKRLRLMEKAPKTISILIPARNEQGFIKDAIISAQKAAFPGKKEIVVIDDSSTDKTNKIAASFHIHLIKTKKHSGKAAALNLGIKRSKGELIAVMDADSIINKDALVNALPYLEEKDCAGVTSVVFVKNRNRFLGMWLHMEQLYNSLIRVIFSKVNANINTPGPLSIYKRKDLESVDGFSEDGYAEDVDITIKLIRAGKKISVSEKSIAETNMPVSVKGFVKQRTRFSRGWIHIFKKHLGIRNKLIDYYTLPLAVFWYVQAIVMSLVVISNVASGYLAYFFSKGIVFNLQVLNFFMGWFSIVGTINWIWGILAGKVALDLITIISAGATLLSYPLYIIAILRYEGFFKYYHVIPLFFMFPFWFSIMIINILNIPEIFFEIRKNRWEKVN